MLTFAAALFLANAPRVSSFAPARTPFGSPIRAGGGALPGASSLASEKGDGEICSTLSAQDIAGVYNIRNEAQHKALLDANMDKLVVLKHFAPWCKTCQRLGPRFKGLARNPKYADAPIIFAELDISDNKRFQSSLGVVALPTLQFYANGEIVETFAAGPTAWPKLGTKIDAFVRKSTTEERTVKPASDVVEEVEEADEGEEAPNEAIVAAQKLLPILGGISYFEQMNDSDFEKALSKASFMTVEEGAILIKEGNFGSKLFVIVEGEVEVCRRLAQDAGAPRSASYLGNVVGNLAAGDYFGERSLITREPCSASVRATATTKVFAFSKFAFERSSMLSGKSAAADKAAEKARLDAMYRLRGEDEGAAASKGAPATDEGHESIIPLLVRFKLVKSITDCFDYIVSNQVDVGQESSRQRRGRYVQMLGASAGAGFKDAFDLIDANGDGHITKPEMQRVADSIGKHQTGADFIRIVEDGAANVYADERIALEDFAGLMAESELYNLLTATFRALDEHDTGYVNAEDLDKVLSGVRGLISEGGKNVLTLGDKEILIDYEQFSKMLLKDA